MLNEVKEKMAADRKESKAGMPVNAYLVIDRQVYPLIRIITSIGRKLENDLVIQDPLISREHAQIRYEDGSFVVYDLGSTGGTFVNNRKVDRSILHTGDIINVANTPVMFINDNPDLEDQSELETGRLSEHDDIG